MSRYRIYRHIALATTRANTINQGCRTVNLQEYFRDYTRQPAVLSAEEFAVSGIPDMGRKWLKRYRYLEVNVTAMRAVVDAIEPIGGRLNARAGRIPQRATEKPQFTSPQKGVAILAQRHKAKRKGASKANMYALANDPAFLNSFEWRQARFATLQRYGRKCQCCGATPATGAVMHVDHIKSRKRYPELSLNLENLQVLCDACNHGKSNQTADFRND